MWPFKKRRGDGDIMIDILEEAARRSYSDEPFELRQYGPAELPIVTDLIESDMVRGTTGHVEGGLAIGLESITQKVASYAMNCWKSERREGSVPG
jgi:hypothetical protein